MPTSAPPPQQDVTDAALRPGAGEGQNVLYTDSHAIFETKPTVGVGQDNIYTQWTHANPQPVDRALGNPPTGTQTPFGNEDSLIYP